jgi:hypothetical protein
MTTKPNKTAARALTAEQAKLGAAVAVAARNEATGMAAVAVSLQAAFKGRKLGVANADGSKSASPFYLAIQSDYYAGCLSTMLPRFGNMPEGEAITAAKAVIADRKRSEADNKALASARQRWCRALDRAGIPSPVAKSPEQTAKAAAARAAGNKVKAGQGAAKVDKSESAALAAAKPFIPPSEKTRESVVAFIRENVARLLLEVEKCNQRAAKTKSPAMPVNILGDLMDLQDRAKKWVF